MGAWVARNKVPLAVAAWGGMLALLASLSPREAFNVGRVLGPAVVIAVLIALVFHVPLQRALLRWRGREVPIISPGFYFRRGVNRLGLVMLVLWEAAWLLLANGAGRAVMDAEFVFIIFAGVPLLVILAWRAVLWIAAGFAPVER